jgi:hypothetical protein
VLRGIEEILLPGSDSHQQIFGFTPLLNREILQSISGKDPISLSGENPIEMGG